MYNRTESYGPRALQRWILMQFGEELVVCCVLCLIVHCADLALVGGGYRHRRGSSLPELVLLHTACLNVGSQSQSHTLAELPR